MKNSIHKALDAAWLRGDVKELQTWASILDQISSKQGLSNDSCQINNRANWKTNLFLISLLALLGLSAVVLYKSVEIQSRMFVEDHDREQ